MSVIYEALRRRKRSESPTMIPRFDAEGNALGLDGFEESEGGTGRWAQFSAWFLEASLLVRTGVVALPLVLLSGIGGGVYWSFFHDSQEAPVVAKAGSPTAPQSDKKGEAKSGARSGIDEELFSGAPEGSGSAVDPAAVLAESESAPVVEEISEEKLLAIFGDSSPPEESSRENRTAAVAGGAGVAPLVVTREEESAALSRSRRGAAKVEESVAPEVLESREREVARVVADLKLAMSRDDAKGVRELFIKLGKVKAGGEKDPFVLNMQAYWEISKGRYDRAAVLLKQVLDRRKDDLEAGLNMALVEMSTRRADEARERLHLLSRLYPGEARIGEMLRYLP
ncbi:MAG: tetratricopeptide repeat protein [Magnetococcales bacterium]|nr:tetratricopeptide repeat protein [Magnetococcales bacterium]